MPIVEYYRDKGMLLDIGGDQSVENVFRIGCAHETIYSRGSDPFDSAADDLSECWQLGSIC